MNNINTRKADVSFGEYELLLHGKPVLEEKIGNLSFEISANSFFQTNTVMAEKKLKAEFGDNVEIEFCMRYGNPSTELKLNSLIQKGCSKIIFL